MVDDPQRPYIESTHREAISLRDYFEALRIADAAHLREQTDQLSLRLQQRFDAQEKSVNTAMIAAEKAVNAALTASEKAVEKAEGAQGLRNAQQNEWRGSLEDLSARMWTREEGSSIVAGIQRETNIRVDAIAGQIADVKQAQGSAVQSSYFEARHAEVVKAIADLRESRAGGMALKQGSDDSLTAVGQAIIDLRKDVKALGDTQAQNTGHSTGMNQAWVYLLGVATIIGLVILMATHWK